MSAPTRILHVSMPTTAGVSSVVLGYVEHQLAHGCSVTVACPDDGWLGGYAADAGARVVSWPAQRNPGPQTLGETRRLAELVDGERPHVVHLHSAKAGLAGRLAVRGRLPTVFQPHAWSFLAVSGPMAAATRRWERHAARWTDALVCVSEEEQRVGAEHGIRPPTWVVPNGVDVNAFRPVGVDAVASVRGSLGMAEAPTVVCVGRLARQKGQDVLLDAWDRVTQVVPTARLVLVGDGPERENLAARSRQMAGVEMVGERDDVHHWLAAADVVAVPSRWEGMALVPLEAMASGRSVVMSDVTGAAESVPPGAGAVVPVDDVEALARELVVRLGDPSFAEREGLAGRRHVERHHSRSTMADAMQRVYAAVLGRAP